MHHPIQYHFGMFVLLHFNSGSLIIVKHHALFYLFLMWEHYNLKARSTVICSLISFTGVTVLATSLLNMESKCEFMNY